MTINQRTPDKETKMKVSLEWYCKISNYEQLRLKAYLCPSGVPTIGYGHTLGVKLGDKISVEQAGQLFEDDLEKVYKAVRKLEPLTQGQFDALTSFVFNVGESKFNSSTLRKMIVNNKTNPDIRNEFRKWKYSKGKVLQGLVKRREDESNRYFE